MTESVEALPVPRPAKTSPDGVEHNRGADLLKFLLMPFVCFWAFGFPDSIGLVSALSGFCVPAFFILSGYFVLVEHRHIRRKKMKRAIERSAITFGVLLACYSLLGAALPIGDQANWTGEIIRKRVLFDFLVLNIWPFSIGSNIWFIQSLLYAYALLLFVSRLGGLKHYKIIMALSMIFMVLVGELAGVIGFRMLDHAYLPGGALTRALPYVLLGMFLREKTERLKAVPGWAYLLVFLLGGGLAVGERYLLDSLGKLVYERHMIGYGVMAAAACGWAVSRPHMKRTFFSSRGRQYAKRVYALANPVYFGILLLAYWVFPRYYGVAERLAGPIVYAACLLLCAIITGVKKLYYHILS